MRWLTRHVRGFPAGITLGLIGAAVAWSLLGATRRRRARLHRIDPADRLIIDGAKDADPAALSARPGVEANSPSSRLESESEVDIFSTRERW
jgi:hypothetical protein